jgi:hypothetical protein
VLTAAVLVLGCDGECLIPCSSNLTIVANTGVSSQALDVTVCDGALCGRVTVQPESCAQSPGGGLGFHACREADVLRVQRSVILLHGAVDAGANVVVSLSVLGEDGVLVEASGTPVVSVERHCGGFDCPQRTLTL